METIAISGVWLRRVGNRAVVAVEVNGQWRDVITEDCDAAFSHIAEISGIAKAPETKL
jgi:hypothetical protein